MGFDRDTTTQGYAEYIVSKKNDGKAILSKLLVILGGAIVAGTELALTLSTIPPASFIFLALIIFVTWFVYNFTNKEYEYVIVQGEIDVDVIYGKRKRKNLLEVKFAQIEKIAPYEKIQEYIKGTEIANTLYACSSVKDSGVYGVVYTTEDGKKNVFYINCVKKTIDSFKYYKKSVLETNGEFDI